MPQQCMKLSLSLFQIKKPLLWSGFQFIVINFNYRVLYQAHICKY